VLLSVPANATIIDNLGVVTIRNDDAAAITANNSTSASSSTTTLKVSHNPAKNEITISGLKRGALNYIDLTDANGRS
jgi:hypothetical protein